MLNLEKTELSTRGNMLTEKERKWLEKRKVRCSYCIHYERDICFWCPDRKKFETSAYSLTPDYRDAAEFEAKVAVVAANGAQPCLTDDNPDSLGGECPEGKERECFNFSPCATRCGLKYARLYVEEEMDA